MKSDGLEMRKRMIIGIGTDIVEVERVLKVCEKDTFLKMRCCGMYLVSLMCSYMGKHSNRQICLESGRSILRCLIPGNMPWHLQWEKERIHAVFRKRTGNERL